MKMAARVSRLVLSPLTAVKNAFWPVRFEVLVVQCFSPIAKKAGLELKQLGKGVFEIKGSRFAVRIREGVGHARDFLVTLLAVKPLPDDFDDLTGEIGLGVIVEFCGGTLSDKDLFLPGRYRQAMNEAAAATEKFCLDFLLNRKDSLTDLRTFIEQKISKSGLRDKKCRFPPNVREEWL